MKVYFKNELFGLARMYCSSKCQCIQFIMDTIDPSKIVRNSQYLLNADIDVAVISLPHI